MRFSWDYMYNVEKTKKVYFVQKPDSTKSTLFTPLGTSQRASQPSREHARFKETNFGFFFGMVSFCV